MKIVKNEQGFVVSVTAIIIAVIVGLMVLYFSNSISLNVTSSANNYSSSQAHWAAVSGIDYAMINLINTGLTDIAGTYPFFNGNIIVDTLTIDPTNQIMQITSRGTHSNSSRILSLMIQGGSGDTLIGENFDNADSISYSPHGAGPGSGRYWGLSCDGAAPPYLPTYVLTGADGCFFFGSKVQNNSDLDMNLVPTNGSGDYILTLSLAAGKDVSNVSQQSRMQNADNLEIYVNGILIEHWRGTSAGGGQPMTPRVGNSTVNLTPHFQEFSFNITQIIGPVATMQITFEGQTNGANKYIGIEGLSLFGSGGYSVLSGGFTEI